MKPEHIPQTPIEAGLEPTHAAIFLTLRACLLHDAVLLTRFADAALSYGMGQFGKDMDKTAEYVTSQLQERFGPHYVAEFEECLNAFGYPGYFVRIDANKPYYTTDKLQ